MNLSSNSSKVAVGLSGGVDSALSAALLVEQGYKVTGVYLECWRAPGCRTEQDRQDALKVALQLGIPFEVLDFKQAYREKVVADFFAEYQAGRTPNPDVWCNKEIKFGLFYDWAMEKGFDAITTGHYAQIIEKNGIYSLASAVDTKKDQTYFLYRLRQEQLSHILFPIGHLTKTQVRAEAKQRGLPVASKPDSQGICFIGEINVHEFLKERLGENPGEVVNAQDEVMGKHQGLWFYTIGQRHGFAIAGSWKSQHGEIKHAMPPYYVIGKNATKNQLIVGFGSEAYRDEFTITNQHWIGQEIPADAGMMSQDLYVRIRHGGKLIPVRSFSQNSTQQRIMLAEPVMGVADGQSAVFYQSINGTHQLVCLGGGVITV